MVFEGMEGFDLQSAHCHPPLIDTPTSVDNPGASAVFPPHDKVDAMGRTALHHAASAGNAHACRAVLASGCATDRLDIHGRSAADHARSAGHFDLAAALEGRRESPEEVAARQPLDVRELVGLVGDNRSIIEQLIAKRRLNARDVKGDTPLHIVARRGKMQIADQLLRSGADLHAANLDGRTPAEVAEAHGHALMAALLSAAAGNDAIPDPVVHLERLPTEADSIPQDNPPVISVDVDMLDALEFEGELAAEEFHAGSDHQEARGDFDRVAGVLQISTGEDEASIEWEPPALRGNIEGDGIGEYRSPEKSDEGEEALRGRRGLRRAARPSCWRRFHIEEAGCAEIVERVVTNGHFTDDDIDDLLGQCRGRFDATDLRLNIRREFEASGLVHAEDVETDLWDVPCSVDAQELVEAVIATCSRNSALPGATEPVPGVVAAQSLTSTLVDTRRRMLAGLVESPRAIDIILYMAERVMTGEIEAQAITAHDYSPNHPTAESQQFVQAVEVLQNAREGVAGGSGKAIRSSINAVEALELRMEFLRDVACVMGETPELRKLAIELAGNLEDFDKGSEALLIAFLPLCRRYAAQQATDDEDQEEVFQAGFFGLSRAVARFQPEPARDFQAFASVWLRQTIVRWRQDEGRLVRVPVHRHEALVKWQRALELLEARCLRLPTLDEMAAELEWSPDDVQRLARIPREAVDFDSLAEEADSDGESGVPESVRVADIVRLINDELEQLPDREADVIRRRYGIDFEDEMTLEEVGQIYGVTRERIRQIEAKGFRRLMHPARMRYLSRAV